jgi:hypothetical protein
MAAIIPPIGLAPGSQYQLIFVTVDKLDALSSTEAPYNAFVAAEASLNPSLPVAIWHAVTSTTDGTNANTNALSDGLPIYNTQGIEVATAGLYTGSLLNPVSYDQFGNLAVTIGGEWTGTTPFGVGEPGHRMADQFPEVGDSISTTYLLEAAVSPFPEDASVHRPLYALSSPITVPTPEPATIKLFGSAFLLLGGIRLIRWRRRD